MREFDTGARRDNEEGKLDFEGFLSPLVLERYAQYMHTHRKQADGHLRDADNWQKGIPLDVYMKSGWRHFFDWWKAHRELPIKTNIEDAICALIFNACGYLHELLVAKAAAKLKVVPYAGLSVVPGGVCIGGTVTDWGYLGNTNR